MTGPAPARTATTGSAYDLRLFVAARVVAVVGSSVTGVAMPLLVYDLSDSAFHASLVSAGGVAPYLVFGLFAGALADRRPRRPIMLASQLASAVALVSVVAAAAAGQLAVGHAIGAALVVATGFVWFDAAAFGALPAIVGRDRIVAANSLVWSTTTLAAVAAPAAGGVLVVAVGPAPALLIDVAAYLLAAVLLLAIGAPMGPVLRSHPGHGGPSAVASLRTDIAEGIRFIRGHAVVRTLTLVGFGNSLAGGAVTALLVVLAAEQHDAGGAAYGVLVTASAAGAFLASLALPWLDRRWGVGSIAVGALTAGVPVALAMTLALPVPVVALLALAWSAVNTLVVLNGIAARQRVTPDRLQARVNTTARMVAWGGMPFGAVLAGAIAEYVGLGPALAMAAGVLAATAGLGTAAGLHRLRVTEPEA